MILLIDSSTPTFTVTVVDGEHKRCHFSWEAGRELARNILTYLNEALASSEATWDDIIGIGVFEGPGSFTGLRIGITVVNTIAQANSVAIVGARGEAWQDQALNKLAAGEHQQVIMPYYGSEAHITSPRK
ncbi:MAG: hypothetical protein JWN33_160 [Candidatus Saccharibacteria bacterium]|nr:hypothetical protein [Candidatus Saccharibacteria bacterium]